MITKIQSCAVIGVESILVEISIELTYRSNECKIVDLSASAIGHLKERVRSAFNTGGYLFPSGRMTITFTPAELPEEDTPYALALALGILHASHQIATDAQLTQHLFLGNLSQDGQCQHTPGILPMVALARKWHIASVFVPSIDAPEASLIQEVTIYPVESLMQVVAHLNGKQPIEPYAPQTVILDTTGTTVSGLDISAIRGQEHVKRVLEVAIAGGHHLLLCASPEVNTTPFVQAMLPLFPRMRIEEVLEVATIYSVSDMLSSQRPLVVERPLRTPHQTISSAELVGGHGYQPRPGEISLAHHGILFLQEVVAFDQRVFDRLIQPLTEKVVMFPWRQQTITYPATCLVVATMRPCPCGHFLNPIKECHCSSAEIQQYQESLSKSLLAYFDMYVEVLGVDEERLAKKQQVETSAVVRARVQNAYKRQIQRFAGTRSHCNAEMGKSDAEIFCNLEASAEQLLHAAGQQLSLSAQTLYRILRVARTIADLAERDMITKQHLAEAIHYRPRLGSDIAPPL